MRKANHCSPICCAGFHSVQSSGIGCVRQQHACQHDNHNDRSALEPDYFFNPARSDGGVSVRRNARRHGRFCALYVFDCLRSTAGRCRAQLLYRRHFRDTHRKWKFHFCRFRFRFRRSNRPAIPSINSGQRACAAPHSYATSGSYTKSPAHNADHRAKRTFIFQRAAQRRLGAIRTERAKLCRLFAFTLQWHLLLDGAGCLLPVAKR